MPWVEETLCELGPVTSSRVVQLFVDGRLNVPEVESNSIQTHTVVGCRHNRCIHFHVDMCFILGAFAMLHTF